MRKLILLFCSVVLPCLSFAQVPNQDMEGWRTSMSGSGTPVSLDIPASWYGSDSIIIGLGQTIGNILLGTDDTDWRRQIFKESSATYVHGGAHSAKIMTRQEATFFIPGVISNAIPSVTISISPPGITGIKLNGGSPITAKPVSVSAWVKYFAGKDSTGSTGVDSGLLTVQALGHVGGKDSVIGTGIVAIGPTSSWAQVTATLVYIDTIHAIDTFRIAFSSGRGQAGLDSSTLYVDDISMITTTNPDNTGVNSVSANDLVRVYPNPSAGIIYLSGPQNTGLRCKLYSADGRVVADKMLSGSDKFDVSNLPCGLYYYSILNGNGDAIQNGKITISK